MCVFFSCRFIPLCARKSVFGGHPGYVVLNEKKNCFCFFLERGLEGGWGGRGG